MSHFIPLPDGTRMQMIREAFSPRALLIQFMTVSFKRKGRAKIQNTTLVFMSLLVETGGPSICNRGGRNKTRLWGETPSLAPEPDGGEGRGRMEVVLI